jgi:Rieske 2Fe-2S family protein
VTPSDRRPGLPAGLLTLPAPYFTDPAIFEREMQAFYFDAWICVGRAESLDAPGTYFVRQVAGTGVVVLRDERGRLGAFHNVCRHRGTVLLSEPEGRLQGRLPCPYHGWCYGLDGRLLSAPHMEKVEGFRREDWPLSAVAAAEWDGHLFVNFAEAPAPLERQLAGLPEKFRPWRMGELRRVERKRYALRTNWKLIVQNYSECLHCPVAHPQLQPRSHYLSGENDPPTPTTLGGRMELREDLATLGTDAPGGYGALPGLSGEALRHVYYYALLPNLMLSLHPDYLVTYTLWPLAPDRTDVLCEWHFHPEQIARPGFDPSGAVEFWDLTNRQDWELTERAYEGIASRGYRPGPYSNREEFLVAFDRLVLEKLRAAGPAGSAAPHCSPAPP